MRSHFSSCLYSNTVVFLVVVLLCCSTSSVDAENNPDELNKLKCAVATQRVQCGDLTCNATTLTCERCTSDEQCGSPKERCTEEGHCVLRTFVDNIDGLGFLAILLAITVCAIAVVAGVGGGGILVPLFVALLGVPMVDAVALSQATIAGQSFFNLLMLIRRHHPDHNAPREPTRPVINYEYLTLLLPISLVGTMYGSLLGKMVPDWFRVVMLMLMLSFLSVRVVKKAVTQFRADAAKKKLNARRRGRQDDDEGEGGNLNTRSNVGAGGDELQDRSGGGSVGDHPSQRSGPTDQEDEDLENNSFIPVSAAAHFNMAANDDWLPDDEDDGAPPPEMLPQYPPRELGLCALMFLILLLCNAIRTLAVDCGTFLYGVMFLLPTLILCGTFYLAWKTLHKRWQLICEGHLLPDEVPFMWSPKTTVLFPSVAIIAGGAAALLGIGGGLVLSTLLFEARLTPEEASATGSVATLLVAAASALQFVLMQQLRFDYGLVFLGAGVVSSIVGQFGLVRPIRRRKWNFMILVSLAFVLIGSMISLSALGIYNTKETIAHHGSLGFAPVCK